MTITHPAARPKGLALGVLRLGGFYFFNLFDVLLFTRCSELLVLCLKWTSNSIYWLPDGP